MKHIKIAVIIMLAVVAAAAAIFFTANYISDKSEKNKKAEEEKLVLFDFDEDSVKKLDIENESGKFTAQYDDHVGYWTISDADFALNDTSVMNAIQYMSTLKATDILDDKESQKYGFDKPIKLTAYTSSDESYTLLVGNSSPTNEYYYVMKEGDDNIYLVDFATGVLLSLNKDSLKSVFPYSCSTYDVTSFTLWKGSESDENILFSMQKQSDESWKMIKPFEDDSVFLSTVDQYLTAAVKDQLNAFIEEGCKESDYPKYGFDKPTFVFEMNTDSKNYKVIFGKDTDDGKSTYALCANNGQVITFEKNTATVLGSTTIDMIDTTIFSPDKQDIKTVEVKYEGSEKTLDINSEYFKADTSVNVTDESSEIDEKTQLKAKYISFFNSFNALKADTLDKKAQPENDPSLSIKYNMADGSENLIEYTKSGDSYYAFKNGEYTGFMVDADSITHIGEAMAELP